MGILKNSVSHQKIILRPCHFFGRDLARSDTLLESRHASQIHASIRWDGKQWELLDHSRNGTTLNGVTLIGGKRTALQPGDKIGFGPGASATWEIENLASPRNLLLPLQDGAPTIELERFHLLPDDSFPEASIYLSDSGQWVWEDQKHVITTLKNEDVVYAGLNSWKFLCSPEIESTFEFDSFSRPDSEKMVFHFHLSQDEEHASIKIIRAGKTLDLEERTHHYFMVTLARKRLDDANRGIGPESQGWIDTGNLSRMLGLDPSHLNIQIFRARSQLAKVLPAGIPVPDVIERRRGEVRFGSFKFHIKRGPLVEGEFNPAGSPQGRLQQTAMSA